MSNPVLLNELSDCAAAFADAIRQAMTSQQSSARMAILSRSVGRRVACGVARRCRRCGKLEGSASASYWPKDCDGRRPCALHLDPEDELLAQQLAHAETVANRRPVVPALECRADGVR